jgi:hypothetical protein
MWKLMMTAITFQVITGLEAINRMALAGTGVFPARTAKYEHFVVSTTTRGAICITKTPLIPFHASYNRSNPSFFVMSACN